MNRGALRVLRWKKILIITQEHSLHILGLDKHLSLSLCLNNKLREIKNQLIKKSAKQIRKILVLIKKNTEKKKISSTR